MFKLQFQRIPVVLLAIFTFNVVAADEAASISEAISNGTGKLGFRYRFENVDQNNLSNDANASTLRTRMNYKTASLQGWYAEIELDDLSYIGDDDFNNTRNGQTSYPVVADPNGTDINEFYIGFKNKSNLFKFGRQRINFDNQRFIGGVGWRQNEQTFDAIYLQNKSIENTTITVGYQNKILRIFGPDDGAPTKEFDAQNTLLNIAYNIRGLGKLVGYGYFLDMEDAAALSNSTIGLRLSGKQTFGNNKFLYTLEFADQDDYGDNPNSYSASYYNVELGLATSMLTIKGGIESLEGNDKAAGEAFTTPLATLHKFQGWADKFLATPAAGIEDDYITVSCAPFGTKAALTYHTFDAQSGSGDYGTEWDFSIARKLNKNFSVLVKYASYDADEHSVDTDKLWVMLTANF